MEKIIQIAVTGVEATQSTQCNYIIVALTADDRLWEMSNTWGWHEIPLPTPTPTVSPEREALEKALKAILDCAYDIQRGMAGSDISDVVRLAKAALEVKP